jgi:hypothetical protein
MINVVIIEKLDNEYRNRLYDKGKVCKWHCQFVIYIRHFPFMFSLLCLLSQRGATFYTKSTHARIYL